jgi:hypothetical protein
LYALLLGLCGDADDAAWLESLLKAPRNERAQANLAGLLAGLIVLDGPRGWAMIRGILEGRDNLGEVLHALSAVRCLQGMKPKEAKPEILKAYRLILAGDLCDLAVEDLRRWGWWDLTADVLALFKPEASPMLKRGLVRYALACPEEPAKKFLEKLRREDPKLVEKVESAAKGK